jgi:GH25 family lysozyme M1 (1,4-beta-N-acetylmuramidase)
MNKKQSETTPVENIESAMNEYIEEFANKKDRICFYTHKLMYDNNLIINQCNDYILEEEKITKSKNRN